MSRSALIAAAFMILLLGMTSALPHAAAGHIVDLEVRALPPPTSLRMRPRVGRRPDADAQTQAADAAPDTPGAAPGAVTQPRVAPRRDDRAELRAPTAEPDRVSFRFNLGMGVDGGQPAPAPATLLNGQPLDAQDYARLRVYYFGDAVLGTRGLLAPSILSYVATQFRFDQDPGGTSSAVPSIHDARIDGDDVRNIWLRSAYGQADGFIDHPLFKPLYVRIGRQYRYGPAIAHFDGVTVGYDARPFTLSAFAGRSVALSGFPVGDYYDNGGAIAGLDARLNIYELNRAPLVLNLGLLRFDGVSHFDTSLALRWSADVSMSAGLRTVDGSLARTHLHVRARISRVTTVSAELESRSMSDWMYDLFTMTGVPYRSDDTDPRTYFDLGAPLPRLYVHMRAGTVLLDNVDVLVHGGAAIRRRRDDFVASSHAAGYVEAGSAIEVRLRRTIGLGLSLLGRRYSRDDDIRVAVDDDQADALDLDTGSVGERSFVESGGVVRYSVGARKFSATAEAYMRYYNMQSSYDIAPSLVEGFDLEPDIRGGARFSVEAWAGERLRLKGEYDVSTALARAPELSGIKSLRIVAEGRF